MPFFLLIGSIRIIGNKSLKEQGKPCSFCLADRPFSLLLWPFTLRPSPSQRKISRNVIVYTAHGHELRFSWPYGAAVSC